VNGSLEMDSLVNEPFTENGISSDELNFGNTCTGVACICLTEGSKPRRMRFG